MKKKQIQNYFNSPVYGDAACPLCENNGGVPPSLTKKLDDGDMYSKTCGDVHLELSMINENSYSDQCSAKQKIYRPTCCPESSNGNGGGLIRGMPKTALGIFVIFILLKRILSLRVRVITVNDSTDNDDDEISLSDYKEMKDEESKNNKSRRNTTTTNNNNDHKKKKSSTGGGLGQGRLPPKVIQTTTDVESLEEIILDQRTQLV